LEVPEALTDQFPARRVVEQDRGAGQTDHNDVMQSRPGSPGSEARDQRSSLAGMIAKISDVPVEYMGIVPVVFEVPLQIQTGDALSRRPAEMGVDSCVVRSGSVKTRIDACPVLHDHGYGRGTASLAGLVYKRNVEPLRDSEEHGQAG
jgi:hypothetical protein